MVDSFVPDTSPPGSPPSGALAPVSGTGLTLASPRRVTLGWAANLVAAVVLLVATSGAWIVGAIFAVAALLQGGSLVPVLAIAATGFLLGRGWLGLVQSVRARLRDHDLSEVEALPDAFHLLSPTLQQLVRHTRTVRAGVQDPELEASEVLRDAFEWITAVAEVQGQDREALTDRGLSAAALRAEVVGLDDGVDPRPAVVDLLARFERALLDTSGDPFRGTVRRSTR